ncbi:MAG: futalosine hydrolase [Desulfovibrio sp.]|jgi:futalosine hydrolase|nr:futalosine hydrolase [Desulfovibrio sp.]
MSKAFALVTATAPEMRAVLAGVLAPDWAPGSPARAALPWAGGESLPRSLRLGAATLHLLLCGIGPLNAALALGRLLGTGLRLDGILNLGLAGSYDLRKAPLGSLVAATEEIWPEYGVSGRGGVSAEALGLPLAVYEGRPVFDRIALQPVQFLKQMELNAQAADLRGPAVTVAGVPGTPARAGRLRERTGGLMENMEGFPLALGCLCREGETLPFVEIRCISNAAGRRPPGGWDLPGAMAGLAAGARLLLSPLRGNSNSRLKML